jgi:hypothetical protein
VKNIATTSLTLKVIFAFIGSVLLNLILLAQKRMYKIENKFFYDGYKLSCV